MIGTKGEVIVCGVQLTSSVRWTQCVQNMIQDGATDFTECGQGKALQGMIAKISKEVTAHGIE